ncbi:MAG: glycosyltransferase family 4 protein [Clostridia bacterium]|nr:glycosyltransferase family 4 protein [Clostridia bacterium]
MKILYVMTISASLTFFPEHFKLLKDMGYTIEVAANFDGGIPDCCNEIEFKIHHIPFSRSPLSKMNLTAFKELKKLVKDGGYDIVHTHTPNASIITRLACTRLRKKGLKVFYTAHGFHFYKGAPLKNWILFYSAEWLCSFFTDKLITMNAEDYERAKTKFHAKETCYVNGVGIDLNRFKGCTVSKTEKRLELGLPEDATVLLSVGELNKNKNHQMIIRVLARLNNPNIHYAIAGVGEKSEYLLNLAKELGVAEKVHLLGYRKDISEINYTADVFCFPSMREGLPVSLMEAMACGLPCAVSKIRGNTDLIDQNGGRIFDPHSVEECENAVRELINGDKASLGEYNICKVEKYSNENVIKQMKEIYQE